MDCLLLLLLGRGSLVVDLLLLDDLACCCSLIERFCLDFCCCFDLDECEFEGGGGSGSISLIDLIIFFLDDEDLLCFVGLVTNELFLECNGVLDLDLDSGSGFWVVESWEGLLLLKNAKKEELLLCCALGVAPSVSLGEFCNDGVFL